MIFLSEQTQVWKWKKTILIGILPLNISNRRGLKFCGA